MLKLADRSDIPLYTRIADALCEAVSDGRIQPGDRLPSEMTLAHDLDVSPLTVGKAYDSLRERGIITRRRGSGTYLASDALRRVQLQGRRHISRVICAIGQSSLADCSREHLAAYIRLLDGMRGSLDPTTCVSFVSTIDRKNVALPGPNDAVVVLSDSAHDLQWIDKLQQASVPVVSLSSWQHTGVPSVTCNAVEAARLACRHLIRCNYRQIGFIGDKGKQDSAIAGAFSGYATELHASDRDIAARYTRHASASPGRAYALARDMIEQGDMPDAIFVDGSYKAVEVVNALRDVGIDVPEQVGVIGFGSVPEMLECDPPLSTVRIPYRAIGQRAAKLLLEWSDDAPAPDSLVVKAELIKRNSTTEEQGVDGVSKSAS